MQRRIMTLLAAVLLMLGMLAGPALAQPPEEAPGAHASIASVLKGATADLVPCHVARGNPPQCD